MGMMELGKNDTCFSKHHQTPTLVSYTYRLEKRTRFSSGVMNQLDPIEELYEMYSKEDDTPRIVEVEDDGLGFDSDLENGPASPYLES